MKSSDSSDSHFISEGGLEDCPQTDSEILIFSLFHPSNNILLCLSQPHHPMHMFSLLMPYLWHFGGSSNSFSLSNGTIWVISDYQVSVFFQGCFGSICSINFQFEMAFLNLILLCCGMQLMELHLQGIVARSLGPSSTSITFLRRESRSIYIISHSLIKWKQQL